MEKDIKTKNITVKDFLYLLYVGKKDANEVYNAYRRTKIKEAGRCVTN